MMPTDQEVEQYIRDVFEENYELVKLEGGHALAPEVKSTALQQVLIYWRKLKSVAETVTDTEVKLNLPEQVTPKGRKFCIEGVVDIVREKEHTTMYDIKTHDADLVRSNIEIYEKQLNVYAYIWQNLRGQPLNRTAVIATSYPESVKEALALGDPLRIESELEKWNPLIDIPYNQEHVDETIASFAEVVDKIEDNHFAPTSVALLQTRLGNAKTLFATRVCRNCDARFSCSSYRTYAIGSAGHAEKQSRQYFSDLGNDIDRQEWTSAALEVAPVEEVEK